MTEKHDPMFAAVGPNRRDPLPDHYPITIGFTQWDDGQMYWQVVWTDGSHAGVRAFSSYDPLEVATFMGALLGKFSPRPYGRFEPHSPRRARGEV